MRRIQIRKKITSVFMAALICLILLPGGAVQAEELAAAPDSYTVTFRPGNVGKFIVENVKSSYPGCNVTENGAIKLTVSKDVTLAQAASNWVEPKEGYFVKTWGPTGNEKVDRNMDFVVDYGKLVNGVEYTIEYVDATTKESVAPAYTTYANIGDKVPVVAPTSLTTSATGVYKLQGSATVELTLVEDAAKNIVVFEYVNDYNPGDEIQEIVNYTDGGTTTVTDTVVIPGGGAGGGAAVAGGGAGAGDAGGNAAGGADDAVVIEDEDTPLAGVIPEGEDGITDDAELDDSEMLIIDDSEVPLADGIGGGFNPVVFCAILVGLAAILMLVLWIVTKKKRKIGE